MPARKTTDLTAFTAPTASTLVAVVDLTEALPANQNKKLTLSDLTKGLSAATAGAAGVVQLSTSTASTSTTLAATPSAVKTTYDLANGKATLTLDTAKNSTSGVVVDFTGLPAGVRRITVMLNGVSTSGTSSVEVRLGDAGGIEATGYSASAGFAGGAGQFTNSTTGFPLMASASVTAANLYSGSMIISNLSGNTWVAQVGGYGSASNIFMSGGGGKTLSDVLTQLRITTVNGTDTFDAGSINILYER